MNDNIPKIRTLTERFFDGETTLNEERQLYAFFSQEPSALPADLLPLREMFLDFAAIQCVSTMSPQQDQETRQALRHRWPRWAAAAAVAVLLIGGAAALFMRNEKTDEDYVAYVYGERTTDRDVVLSEMQKTMTALAATDGSDVVEEQLKAMFSN